MGTGFGTTGRRERERLVFMAAGGLAFSLIIITVVILDYRQKADAKANLAQEMQNQIPLTVGTVTVYSTNQPVVAGTKLDGLRFEPVLWPIDKVPSDAVRDLSELSGLFAKVDLVPGSPLRRAEFTKEPSSLALPLTSGMRAVTISITDTSGVEGWALPGSRVDVIASYTENGEAASKVIVQNARVLSLGRESRRQDQSGRANMADSRSSAPATTITLEVSTSDVLRINTAKKFGELSLALRSPEDSRPVRDTETDRSAVTGNVKPEAQSKDPSKCRRGQMKMEGKTYVIECDGTITQLMSNGEP